MKRGMFLLHCGLSMLAALLPPAAHAQTPERVWGLLLEEGTTETLVKQITVAHTHIAEDMRERHGLNMKIVMYNDPVAFRRDVAANRIHYGVISTHRRVTDMADLRIRPLFTPFLTRAQNDTYSLLVSSRSTIRHPSELVDKEIMLHINGTPLLLEGWTRGLIGSTLVKTQVDSPRRAVYPVFYGQKEACVVSTQSYEVLKELNPQFEGRLREIAVSPCLPLVIIFCLETTPPDEQNKVIQFAEEMTTGRRGKQVMSLTRIGHLAPFQEKHLEGVRKTFGMAQPSTTLRNVPATHNAQGNR